MLSDLSRLLLKSWPIRSLMLKKETSNLHTPSKRKNKSKRLPKVIVDFMASLNILNQNQIIRFYIDKMKVQSLKFVIIQSLNMNNNFMLQNFIENGNSCDPQEQKARKSSKVGTHELQLLVGTIFNQVCQLLEDNQINIQIPEEVSKITDKAKLLKHFIEQLVNSQDGNKQRVNQSGIIACKDCQNYEASLQKLQGQVRQHIRLEQQLKIFQDNQEQKLDEYKKQKKQFQKKLENSKKQLEDIKNLNSSLNEKMNKMQGEIDSLKKENRELKRNTSTNNEALSTKRQNHKQPTSYAYESKQNKIDWVHRNISVKKDEKEKQFERKSIEKRNDSTEKGWRQSNTKSNKMISIMNEKLIHEKTKEQRKKIIQSKFQYRR